MIIDYDKDQLSYALANALKERDEAKELAEKMFRERAEALKEIHNQFVEYDKLFDEAEQIRRERDELLRDKAEREREAGHLCDSHRDMMGDCIVCSMEETK
jgi:hypothetical protein